MPDHIIDKDIEHFLCTEEMRKKVAEIHNLFEGVRKNIDAIIIMLDEVLAHEEVVLRRKHDQYCIGCTRNLSLEDQEFLRNGNTKLEP